MGVVGSSRKDGLVSQAPAVRTVTFDQEGRMCLRGVGVGQVLHKQDVCASVLLGIVIHTTQGRLHLALGMKSLWEETRMCRENSEDPVRTRELLIECIRKALGGCQISVRATWGSQTKHAAQALVDVYSPVQVPLLGASNVYQPWGGVGSGLDALVHLPVMQQFLIRLIRWTHGTVPVQGLSQAFIVTVRVTGDASSVYVDRWSDVGLDRGAVDQVGLASQTGHRLFTGMDTSETPVTHKPPNATVTIYIYICISYWRKLRLPSL